MPRRRKKRKSSFVQRLVQKYRIHVINEDQFEAKAIFRISLLRILVYLGIVTIVMVTLTVYLAGFTGLREYVPGYADISSQKRIYELINKTDSLEKVNEEYERYLRSLKIVLSGEVPIDSVETYKDTTTIFRDYQYKHSKEDSLLRVEVAQADQFNLAINAKSPMRNILFFTPLRGEVDKPFDKDEKHFGVDIVATKDEAVKCVLDGVVVFSEWTSESGYVIAIQHSRDLISIYKHNAVLLKQAGAFVRSGDPIAIVGNSGEMRNIPHLHFELWQEGIPVDPQKFISF